MAFWNDQAYPSGLGRLADRLGVVLGWMQFSDDRASESDTADELRRLAETSPHLLADLGFRRGPDNVWSNGRTRVAVGTEPVANPLIRSGRI